MTTPETGGERVRLCLNCGEMVDFDVRSCPACGHFEPRPRDDRVPRIRIYPESCKLTD